MITKARIRRALRESNGNITRMGISLGIGKRHAIRLVARHGLNDLAATLRIESGGVVRGRPPRDSPISA